MRSKAGDILDFLSRFLPLADQWANDWKKFNATIKELEENIIFPSACPDKKKFRLSMDFVLERLFFYCRFPWIGGKLLIARVGYPQPVATGLSACKNVPVLYASGIKSALYNPAGCVYPYPLKEINPLLHSIQASSGDIDAIFSLISIPDHSLPSKTIIIDFPALCSADNIFFRPALAAAEQIMLYPSGFLFKSAIRFLKTHRPDYPVWIEPIKDMPGNIPRKSDEPKPDWRTAGYIPFRYLCESVLQPPVVWNKQRKEQYEQRARQLTEDIIMNDADPKLKQILKQTRDNLGKQLAEVTSWLEAYERHSKSLKEQASGIDDYIIRESRLNPVTEITYQHNNDWRIAEQYVLDLILEKNHKALDDFTARLAAARYPYASILDTAKAVLGFGYPDRAIFNIDNWLARVLCVLVRDKTGFGDIEVGRRFAPKIMAEEPGLASRLPEIDFVAGIALFLNGDPETGAAHLRQALKNGHTPAGKWLYDLAKQSGSQKDIKFLAKNLVPDACYDAAMANGKYPSYGWPLFMLYVAASHKHTEALRALAKIEEKKAWQSDDDAEKSAHKNHAIGIYKFLLQNNASLTSKEFLALGSMLHQEQNYQSALEYLGKSSEAEAHYLLGRMHHYGDGTAIDYDKARTHYTIAVNLGFYKAEALLAKLEAKERRKAESASNRSSYREERECSSSSSSDSGSFCFLTTATCKIKGYTDDCHVLETYRRFRDEILLQNEEGKILVKEYYRIAPHILQKIDARADKMEIYETMWNDFLEPGYKLVLAKQNIAARDLYISLVKWLLKKLR